MYDFLKDHALKNVWCTPDQDNQVILAPAKITPSGGVLRSFRIMWRKIYMPDAINTWHVYQIGQLHPLILGLLPQTNVWQKFSDACNTNNMICDIYSVKGIQLPRFQTWYMYNEDRDLIIAVRENNRILIDLNQEAVFLRVYTNAYFDSARHNALTDKTHTEGSVCLDTDAIMTLQTIYLSWLAKPGVTLAFVNGIKVTGIDLIQMAPGDVGEMFYDSSVKKVIDFRVQNIQSFQSILDSKMKYLLHYAGVDDATIDYRDDIDVYIIDTYALNRHRGLLYNRNQNDSLRQVTHRDYSVPSAYINAFTSYFQNLSITGRVIDPQQFIVRLHVRKSGYLRPLINENHRIAELYKMQDADIVRAMLGYDSVVNVWKAENLENSDYIKIMDSKGFQITNELIQSAYGYNSIADIIGRTPSKTYTFSSNKVIDVPYGLQSNSTAYEYDVNGKLLGWYYLGSGTRYTCTNFTCITVEMISGIGSELLSDKRAPNNILLDTTQSYRVYRNQTSSIGVPADWIDVTGTDQYIVNNNYLQRSDNLSFGNFLVRDEKRFLAYDLSLSMTTGELRFGLTQKILINNTLTSILMEIPMDQIDIFLNGRSLIRGLDYHLNFPEVAIVNKEYLVNPLTEPQKIHVRVTGLCGTNLQFRKAENTGFVEFGLLSNNNKYDLRNDRVLRIIVDGKLYNREDLTFSEFNNGVSLTSPLNGKPYSVQDITVPLKSLTTEPTFVVKQQSQAIDTSVAAYLTIKIPQPTRIGLNVITNRYKLFSPFVSRLIYDLFNNSFDFTNLDTPNYNDAFVLSKCSSYLHLLKTDPTQNLLQVNFNYVVIHPHNLDTVIDLEFNSYRFLQRAVKLYTNNKVILSPFVRVKPF